MLKLLKYEFKNRYKLFLSLLIIYLLEHLYIYNKFKFEPMDEIRYDIFFLNFSVTTCIFVAMIFSTAIINFYKSLEPKPGYNLFMVNISKPSIYISKIIYHLIEFASISTLTLSLYFFELNKVNLNDSLNVEHHISLFNLFVNTPEDLRMLKNVLSYLLLFYVLIFLLLILLITLFKFSSNKTLFKSKVLLSSACIFFIRNKAIHLFDNINEASAPSTDYMIFNSNLFLLDSVLITLSFIGTFYLFRKKVNI